MDDIRYSEFLFLQEIARGKLIKGVNGVDGKQAKMFDVDPAIYPRMIVTLIEDMYIWPESHDLEIWAIAARGHFDFKSTGKVPWKVLEGKFQSSQTIPIRITYRGLRRIEELRDILKKDRILEPFGILLDDRYFLPDFKDTLSRSHSPDLAVIYSDMDDFKPINDKHGHDAGDAVMESYLATVKDCVGNLGSAYRGRGDEVVSLVVGQGRDKCLEIANSIRSGIAGMNVVHNGMKLPSVTASVGIACSPPLPRSTELKTLADHAQMKAKKDGKNRVVEAK